MVNADGLLGTQGTRFRVASTSSASKAEPSWNLTPWRSLNSHVVSSIAFQDVASAGVNRCSASCATRYSKTWVWSATLGLSAWKCGSAEVTEAPSPTASSFALRPKTATDRATPSAPRAMKKFMTAPPFERRTPQFRAVSPPLRGPLAPSPRARAPPRGHPTPAPSSGSPPSPGAANTWVFDRIPAPLWGSPPPAFLRVWHPAGSAKSTAMSEPAIAPLSAPADDAPAADHTTGILPSQSIRYAITAKLIQAPEPILEDQIQPASLDLRLGPVAYRVKASFLTGRNGTVKAKLEMLELHRFDITGGAVLEKDCVYIIPLLEHLNLRK